MNVQQMQEAVYEGVFTAMSAAMRGQNGGTSQEIRVYLDGKEITASVKKHQHESGAALMGNEVYSYLPHPSKERTCAPVFIFILHSTHALLILPKY